MSTTTLPALPITLNGERRELAPGATLPDALRLLGVEPEHPGIAVALNETVVPRSRWAQQKLEAGDALEVITATQGG